MLFLPSNLPFLIQFLLAGTGLFFSFFGGFFFISVVAFFDPDGPRRKRKPTDAGAAAGAGAAGRGGRVLKVESLKEGRLARSSGSPNAGTAYRDDDTKHVDDDNLGTLGRCNREATTKVDHCRC